jgi:hypothetical protein
MPYAGWKRRTGRGSLPGARGQPGYVIVNVLHGRKAMPSFGDAMNDDQVATVVNYTRTHFGNRFAGSVTPSQVRSLRRVRVAWLSSASELKACIQRCRTPASSRQRSLTVCAITSDPLAQRRNVNVEPLSDSIQTGLDITKRTFDEGRHADSTLKLVALPRGDTAGQ